jgi:hypothetical protein
MTQYRWSWWSTSLHGHVAALQGALGNAFDVRLGGVSEMIFM